jgi:hypothetical protein
MTVEENRGRPRDAAGVRAAHVSADAFGTDMITQVGEELVEIKPEVDRRSVDPDQGRRARVLEHHIEQCPEGILGRGGLKRLGRELSIGRRVGERKMAYDVPQRIRKPLPQIP